MSNSIRGTGRCGRVDSADSEATSLMLKQAQAQTPISVSRAYRRETSAPPGPRSMKKVVGQEGACGYIAAMRLYTFLGIIASSKHCAAC